MADGQKHFLVGVYVLCLCSFIRAANVASGKTATLSSRAPHWNRAASLAVDGSTNTDFYGGSCVATAEQRDPWLRVDLGRLYMVKSVNLYLLSTDLFYVYFDQVEYPQSGVKLGSDKTFDECLDLCRKDTTNNCRAFVRRNRARDNCYRVNLGRRYQKDDTYTQNKGKSLANLQISISETVNGAKTVCHVETSPLRNDSSVNYTCARPAPGRYVTLKVSGSDKILSLCEVQVDGVIPTITSGPASESVTSHGFTIRWGSCQHGENGLYRFEYRGKHAGEWTTKNATSRVAVVTGLLHNHQYYVRVSCYWKDSSGLFRLIPGVHEEIVVKTLCTVPGNVTITEATPTLTGDKSDPQTNIMLAWQHVDSGCDMIESYTVQYKVAGSTTWLSAAAVDMNVSTLGITHTIRGLQPHATYSVRVRAKNNDQKWSQSEVREVKTKEGWSSAVQSLRHVARSDSLTLTWQTPANSRGVIAGYKVSFQLRKRSTCSYVHETWANDVMVTSLSYDLIGLHPYSEYNVRVVPVNGAGDGVDQTLNVRTAAAEPTSSPSGFFFKSKTSKSITLGWSAADCNGMNGVFRHYEATLRGIEYDNRTLTNTTRDVTWTVDGLVPHALYGFTVTTVNNVGSSDVDFIVRVRTDEARPPPPTDVRVSISRLDALLINWTTAVPPRGVILNYEVRFWITNHVGSTNVSITKGNETGVHLNNLEHHSNYSVQVRGRTAIGWGEWSNVMYAFTDVDQVSGLGRETTPAPPGGHFVDIIVGVSAAVVVCIIIGVVAGVVIYRRRKSPPHLTSNIDRRNDQQSRSTDKKLQQKCDDKGAEQVAFYVGEGYQNLQGFSKEDKGIYEEIKEGRV